VLDGPRGAAFARFLPVHLYGQVRGLERVLADRTRARADLIEDAAQAWGAEWNGVKAGGLGDAAAFSFYPTKNLSAAGDAGMVTTNSDETGRAGEDAAPARHAPALLPRRAGLERAHGRIPGRGALQVKLKYIDGMERGAARGGRGAITRCLPRQDWPRPGRGPCMAWFCRASCREHGTSGIST
jgi:hypothetical protein